MSTLGPGSTGWSRRRADDRRWRARKLAVAGKCPIKSGQVRFLTGPRSRTIRDQAKSARGPTQRRCPNEPSPPARVLLALAPPEARHSALLPAGHCHPRPCHCATRRRTSRLQASGVICGYCTRDSATFLASSAQPARSNCDNTIGLRLWQDESQVRNWHPTGPRPH